MFVKFTNKFKKENKLKLKQIKSDRESFESLISGKVENIDANIIINYYFFIDYIKNSGIDPYLYYKAFRRVWIVYIELDRQTDDSQLIFESINSTGLALSQADLIRNFILMNKNANEQTYLFENYWSKIEDIIKNENISNFIRDYLTMKSSIIPNKKMVYREFKKFYKQLQVSDEEFLKELLYFSKIYHYFLYFDFGNKAVNNLLYEISVELNTKVVFVFLLGLFDEFEKNSIDLIHLIKSLELIRDYIFRRLICEYSSNALNKIFANLFKEIKRKNGNDFYDTLVYVLLSKKGQGVYPKDSEFKDYFLSKNMYKFNAKKYLLYKIESYNNKELVKPDELTIEHIMPQKIGTKWSIILGDKYKEVHEKYLNNIGNLTLTAYNSNLSNKDFNKKKDILLNSNLNLNRYFASIYSWNKDEIEKRAKYLFDITNKIFCYPDIDKDLFKEEKACYNLDEIFDATGRKIKNIEIFGQKIKTKSWIEAFVKSCELFYELDKKKFNSFTTDIDFKGKKQRIISSNTEDLRKGLQVKNGIFIESNLSANSILNIIKLIAEKYELSGDDIIFSID